MVVNLANVIVSADIIERLPCPNFIDTMYSSFFLKLLKQTLKLAEYVVFMHLLELI